MATHDYVIANGSGAAVRSDLNNALAAIVSNNSSSTEPATTYAFQWWADTNENVLKIRNSANNAWITLRELDGTMLIEDGSASTPSIAFADDTNTGIFSGAADQIAFATGGAERLEIGSSEVVFNDPSNDVDFRVESNGNTHMLFVDAGNDRVGIGQSSPAGVLHTSGSSDQTVTIQTTTSGADTRINFRNSAGTDAGGIHYQHNGNALAFNTGGSNAEAARIDSNGRFKVGTTGDPSNKNTVTPTVVVDGSGVNGGLQVNRHTTVGGGGAQLLLSATRGSSITGHTVLQDDDGIGTVEFIASDGDEFVSAASIKAAVDGTPGGDDMPGRLVFSTTADGASGPTERMRITSAGALKASTTGSFYSTNDAHELRNSTSNTPILLIQNTNGSYADHLFRMVADRGASQSYDFGRWESGGVGGDNEYRFRGDGSAFADGDWNAGGADYAEFFEWSDGNGSDEDRRGISVVLVDDKIREAVAGEDPIGVISGNPSVVGDAAWNKWSGKHLRDDYGSYVLDANGDRQLNPDYDPDLTYVPREERPEWGCVGLMGKLRIRTGQVTGSRWIKMRDVSATVEEWLVR